MNKTAQNILLHTATNWSLFYKGDLRLGKNQGSVNVLQTHRLGQGLS